MVSVGWFHSDRRTVPPSPSARPNECWSRMRSSRAHRPSISTSSLSSMPRTRRYPSSVYALSCSSVKRFEFISTSISIVAISRPDSVCRRSRLFPTSGPVALHLFESLVSCLRHPEPCKNALGHRHYREKTKGARLPNLMKRQRKEQHYERVRNPLRQDRKSHCQPSNIVGKNLRHQR